MKTIEARAIISAKDATGAVFQAIQSKIARLNSVAKSASSKVNAANARADSIGRANVASSKANSAARAIGTVGAGVMGLPGLGAVGAAAGAVKAIKRYGETDLALTRIGITADATDKQISDLDHTVRKTAFDTGKSFDQVAAGLDSIVAGGVDLDKALALLPSVTKTAQASGAEVADMANTSLALNQSLGISAEKMQAAFDIMVAGGKAGKFELKDMSRYMASFGPAAAAAGYKGEAGLKRIVSVLQTIRQGSGTAEEAASSFSDLLGKMETEETTNKFKKFGIDIRAEMDKTRKVGGDMIQTLLDQAEKAVKGDLSKLPQLFGDKEIRRAVTALLTYKGTIAEVMGQLNKSAGSTAADLDRVLKRPQMAINRLSEGFDRAITGAGRLIDLVGGSKVLNEAGKAAESIVDAAENPDRKKQTMGAAYNALDATRLRALEEHIAAQEQRARDGSQSWLDRVKGTKLPALDQRLNSPEIRALRQQAFNARQRLYRGGDRAETREVTFDPAELRGWQEAEEGRKAATDFINRGGMPRPSREEMKRKRVSAYMGWTGSAPNEGGNYDALGLGYQGGGEPDRRVHDSKVELTGSAEVKGQTEVTVKVEAGSSLIAVEAETRSALAELRGLMRAGNGPGSTGRSSPDAAPNGRGSSGGW